MAEPTLDLSTVRRIHVVGVGGAAMSAIARILRTMGHAVGGTDAAASAVTERLVALGVDVHVGHDAAHLDAPDVVVASTAIPADNSELVAARAMGIPVLTRAEAMAAICAARRTVAVAGTHGKTTTTAMLALILRGAGLDPSFLVGGDVGDLGSGTAWRDGELFVVEADESDGTFLSLGADAVVVTNVEPDHLDLWGSWDNLREGFRRFIAAAPGPRIVCADDVHAAALAADVGGCTTYGTSAAADHRLVDVLTTGRGVSFTIEGLGSVSLPVPGLHNARNAAAAAVMATQLGVAFDDVGTALAAFPGVARRFEHRGEVNGATLIDSYDHLPTEVASVLAAARAGEWRRVVCVFQPHRFTRTAALWRDFADSFVDADALAVTDIYPAGQQPIAGVTGKLIVDAVLAAHPRARVAWLPQREGLRRWLQSELRPGDLCLTLGAGDLTTLPDELLAAYR